MCLRSTINPSENSTTTRYGRGCDIALCIVIYILLNAYWYAEVWHFFQIVSFTQKLYEEYTPVEKQSHVKEPFLWYKILFLWILTEAGLFIYTSIISLLYY